MFLLNLYKTFHGKDYRISKTVRLILTHVWNFLSLSISLDTSEVLRKNRHMINIKDLLGKTVDGQWSANNISCVYRVSNFDILVHPVNIIEHLLCFWYFKKPGKTNVSAANPNMWLGMCLEVHEIWECQGIIKLEYGTGCSLNSEALRFRYKWFRKNSLNMIITRTSFNFNRVLVVK